jgi:hypothetical protein
MGEPSVIVLIDILENIINGHSHGYRDFVILVTGSSILSPIISINLYIYYLLFHYPLLLGS